MEGKYQVYHRGAPIEEPSFVLRAKDVFALEGVRMYLAAVQRHHPNPDFVSEIHLICADFLHWRQEHPEQVKIPD